MTVERAKMLLTKAEAAEALGASIDFVRGLVESGAVGFVRIGNDERVPRDDLERWWRSQVRRGAPGSITSGLRNGIAAAEDVRARVYFIRCGDFIKIGIAGDVHARLRNLQGANPLELELLGSIAGSAEVEADLHRQFASHRVRGEWFRSDAELLDAIEQLLLEAANAT